MSNETATMKKSKRTLTPKLRFPEFRDEPGWESESLGRLFANRQEKGFSELPLLSVTDERGIIPQEETNRKDNSNSDKSRYLRVVPGDIAYNTMRMWEGRSAYVDREGLVSPAYTVCQPQKGIHGKFFSYYFKTSSLIEQFRKYSQGLVRDTLSLKYNGFACISIPSPPFAEQQKIADCLNSLDGLITAEGRKLEALKAHKKGLMQQLFPQPGQTQPRLRFPEFRDKGEWKPVKLSEVFEEYREKSTVQDQYEVLTSARRGLIRQKDYYGEGRITGRDNVGFNIIPPNYITYRSRADDRLFYFNENDLGITGIISTYYPVFRLVDGSNKFFIEFLAHHRETLGKYSVGTSQTVLSLPMLGRIKLPLPTPAEQQKVADCLFSLDTQLTAQAAKIESLKQHKRGLMQQLFPTPEEVEA
jgi:type I restriction enzyme S subunit